MATQLVNHNLILPSCKINDLLETSKKYWGNSYLFILCIWYVCIFLFQFQISSPKAKSSSGEWLFGTDDNADDGLFNNSATKPLVLIMLKLIFEKASDVAFCLDCLRLFKPDNRGMQIILSSEWSRLGTKHFCPSFKTTNAVWLSQHLLLYSLQWKELPQSKLMNTYSGIIARSNILLQRTFWDGHKDLFATFDIQQYS